jgi:4a-hydroxytetrahydrobiopterin dehydratase
MTKLPRAAITRGLKDQKGWKFSKNALVRELEFRSFPDVVAFVTRLAFEAEAADHHPDLQISYTHVTVSWSTHSEGGVTAKDFVGATQTDIVARRIGVVRSKK